MAEGPVGEPGEPGAPGPPGDPGPPGLPSPPAGSRILSFLPGGAGNLAAGEDQPPDTDELLDSLIDALQQTVEYMSTAEFDADFDDGFDQLAEGWEETVLEELQKWDAERAQADLVDPFWEGVESVLDDLDRAFADPEFIAGIHDFITGLKPRHVAKLLRITRLGQQILHKTQAELDDQQSAKLAELLAETVDELDRLQVADDVEVALEVVDYLIELTESELQNLGVYDHIEPVWNAIVDSVEIVTDFVQDNLLA